MEDEVELQDPEVQKKHNQGLNQSSGNEERGKKRSYEEREKKDLR